MTHKQSKLEKALLQRGVTEEEALALIKSARGKPSRKKQISHPGERIKYGYMSDTHIGHEKFDKDLFYRAANAFKDEKVDFVVHPGDHLEGMSGRPGHIYELSQIGFQQQFDEACNLYAEIPCQIYGIDGNHDQWFKQKNNNGVVVGEQLEKALDNYTHLGEWEGDLEVGGKAPKLWIKLFHGNDGTAYADSYKLQKLIESFTGGEKPHIVHSGHYHKAIHLFRRNVHGFESGTICGQSQFMRGKKLQAHKGFGIVELLYNKFGVQRLKHEFYPDYD